MAHTLISPRLVIVTLFLLGIFLVLAFQVRSQIPFRICYSPNQPVMRGGGRSSLHSKMITFEQIDTLESLSHESDHAWSSDLMPPNGGFIFVEHNETYNIKQGISMFHALHCLALVRSMLQDREAPSSSHHPRGNATGQNEPFDHFLHHAHMPHCLRYIAQVSLSQPSRALGLQIYI